MKRTSHHPTPEQRAPAPRLPAGPGGAPGPGARPAGLSLRLALQAALLCWGAAAGLPAAAQVNEAKAQHAAIGVRDDEPPAPHTSHPDAQWYPQAGFGLFVHWGLASVFDTRDQRVGDLSWAMIAGAWKNKVFNDPQERARIIREADWNFDGKPNPVTPNQYFAAAKDFNPQRYDPDRWAAAAKEAGFTYIVLTTRHHEGYALWPSAYGDFSTKNHMGGRDLVRPFVEAARKHGLKVGLYYSPPDWHFDREYMNFMYYGTVKLNPWLPELDADLKARTVLKSAQEKASHLVAYNAMVKGQVEELLTRYGKIDLLWFDGAIPAPAGAAPRLTEARVRELQPGIVLSPRYFHQGDYNSYEGPALKTATVARDHWAEWCTTWSQGWSYSKSPYYATGFELANLARARSLNINLLLNVGPDANGELPTAAYRNLAIVSAWMKFNRPAVQAGALPPGESSPVPATAAGKRRFLFALPEFTKAERPFESDLVPPADRELVLDGLAAAPLAVTLLGDGLPVPSEFKQGRLTVKLAAARRTTLPDVVEVRLP